MTAADHANTVPDWLKAKADYAEEGATLVTYKQCRELAAIIDALQHQAKTAEEPRIFRLEREARLAAEAERDAAVRAAEQARNALERWIADAETNSEAGAPDYARAALAGNQP